MMAAADRVTIDHHRPWRPRCPRLHGRRPGAGGRAHHHRGAKHRVAQCQASIDSAVISLCAVQAGDPGALSVIPGSATLTGTVRTFNPVVQDLVERSACTTCAARWRWVSAPRPPCTTSVSIPPPSTRDAEAVFAADVAQSLVGEGHVVRDMEPSMGSEDFSFMLQVKPGAYLRIGQGGEGSCFLHNSRYDFNDEILPLGAALHASLVEQALPLSLN
jgi:metal-dependent amidase/aminoacylase/carboxypeptidase family protein